MVNLIRESGSAINQNIFLDPNRQKIGSGSFFYDPQQRDLLVLDPDPHKRDVLILNSDPQQSGLDPSYGLQNEKCETLFADLIF